MGSKLLEMQSQEFKEANFKKLLGLHEKMDEAIAR